MATFNNVWSEAALRTQFKALSSLFDDVAYYQWVYDAYVTEPDVVAWKFDWRKGFHRVKSIGRKKWTLNVAGPLHATSVVRVDDGLIFDVADETCDYNGRIIGMCIWARITDPEHIVFIPWVGNTNVITAGSVISIGGQARIDKRFAR